MGNLWSNHLLHDVLLCDIDYTHRSEHRGTFIAPFCSSPTDSRCCTQGDPTCVLWEIPGVQDFGFWVILPQFVLHVQCKIIFRCYTKRNRAPGNSPLTYAPISGLLLYWRLPFRHRGIITGHHSTPSIFLSLINSKKRGSLWVQQWDCHLVMTLLVCCSHGTSTVALD